MLSRGLQPLAYLPSAKTPTIPILITLRVWWCLLQFKTTINLPECLHSPRPQPMIEWGRLWRGAGWAELEFPRRGRLRERLGLLSTRPVAREPPRPPPRPQTNLMWKPGSLITPHAALRPPVFPPSLPFLGPDGLGDGLYFAPQKHTVFFNTAGYSICKGLASEVLWISITTEVPLESTLLPERGAAVVRKG